MTFKSTERRLSKAGRDATAALMIAGCVGASYTSTTATPAQCAAYNAAISAHDPVRLRTFLVEDYHLIAGTTGRVDSGGDAATRGYADEEFKYPTLVTCRRTPTTVVNAASGNRVAETGRLRVYGKSRMGQYER